MTARTAAGTRATNLLSPEAEIEALATQVGAALTRGGYAHLTAPLDPLAYQRLAEHLGEIIGRERVALRPGAHAYIAKPGPVPLHTDQPQVEIVGWLCQEQDPDDGASRLLDSRPIVATLSKAGRHILRDVDLWTPPLGGGPPTDRWPVLRPAAAGTDELFCSPWLRPVHDRPAHAKALTVLRERLSAAASSLSIHLRPGEALFVDNRRVLHGRGRIREDSRRCLLRVWLRRRPQATS